MELKKETNITTSICATTAIGSDFTGDEKEAAAAAASRRERVCDDSAKTEREFACCGTGLQTAATDDIEDEPEETKDMEIEMNEDGCCTVKVAVPQLIRVPSRDYKNHQENSEAGEHSLNTQFKPGDQSGNKENETVGIYERDRDFVDSGKQSCISILKRDNSYQEKERGRGEKRGRVEMFVDPLPILNLPEEPTVRHVHQTQTHKDFSPNRKGEMETSFYYTDYGIPTDQREGTIQDGVTSGIAKCNSAMSSFDEDLGRPIKMNDIKGREDLSPDMSREKEQTSQVNVDSSKVPCLSKYPKKKVTLKMTKRVEEFNNTMIDEDDFPLEPSVTARISNNEPKANFKKWNQRQSTSIEIPPADYSRRRSKIESFGAKSKQFKSIGQCEFCALHLEKVLRGDFPRYQNVDSRKIRARSSEIDTSDQQMRRERFYHHPQRSVGDVIYQEIYNEEQKEQIPQNSVHTIMLSGSSRSKQYFQTYSNEFAPTSRSIDVPDLPPSFNPGRRRTIEELKNFSITIPVQIKKQPSQDSGGRQSLNTGRELDRSQKHSVYSTRVKSNSRDRNSSIHGRERRHNSSVDRSRKATLSTRDLPAGTYTSPEDPAALEILLLESKPANYLWLALCTTIFFNPIFGIVALVLSMQSDAAFAKKRYQQARRLGRAVKYVSLLGMGTTVGVIIILTVELGSPQIN